MTKAVTGDAPSNDPYEICVEGPDPVTTTECKTVGAGQTAIFENLVPGTYKVTETNPGAEYTVTITPATVDVTIGGLARPPSRTSTRRCLRPRRCCLRPRQ